MINPFLAYKFEQAVKVSGCPLYYMLCFDHLRQSLDKAVPASAARLEILLEDALETLKTLDNDLRGHISKYDYDKKAPRSEGEQFSWLRAIYFFTGRREGDNPKPEFSDSQT